jgi:hypothetical protein
MNGWIDEIQLALMEHTAVLKGRKVTKKRYLHSHIHQIRHCIEHVCHSDMTLANTLCHHMASELAV